MESPIAAMRRQLTEQIKNLQVMADGRPTNGAELTLAIRHLQDARMRLGVAMAIENGQDPWAS